MCECKNGDVLVYSARAWTFAASVTSSSSPVVALHRRFAAAQCRLSSPSRC
jgi:hypothetical protein